MAVYSRLYSDFQHSSRIGPIPSASDSLLWTMVVGDETSPEIPECLLSVDGIVIVQTRQSVAGISSGRQLWQLPRDSAMHIVVSQDRVIYRGVDGSLYAVDFQGKPVLTEMELAACYDLCALQLVFPIDNDRYLIQTANRAPEAEDDSPQEPDNYNLVLQGAGGWMDQTYLHEFKGNALPGLITNDLSRVVLLNEDHQVLVHEIVTGKLTSEFVIEGTGFFGASLDPDDNLIVIAFTPERVWKLFSFTLDGKQNWEFALPDGSPDHYWQPPAIDSNGDVILLWGTEIFRVSDGELVWKTSTGPFVPRFVTLVDNQNVILAAGHKIEQIDAEGNKTTLIEMTPGETITTPVVTDYEGRLLVGGDFGVRWYE